MQRRARKPWVQVIRKFFTTKHGFRRSIDFEIRQPWVQNPNFDIYSLGELGRLTSPSLLLPACRMTVIIPALEDMEKELNEIIYVKYLGEYLVHGWCQISICCHWYKERVASAALWRMVGVRGRQGKHSMSRGPEAGICMVGFGAK